MNNKTYLTYNNIKFNKVSPSASYNLLINELINELMIIYILLFQTYKVTFVKRYIMFIVKFIYLYYITICE